MYLWYGHHMVWSYAMYGHLLIHNYAFLLLSSIIFANYFGVLRPTSHMVVVGFPHTSNKQFWDTSRVSKNSIQF